MNIKLLSLRLINFKSFSDKEILFNGEDAVISGTNEVGKSTIKNAFLWVLTGKDEFGRENYEIRTTGKSVETVPTVTAEIDVDGEAVVLERRLEPTYTGKGIDQRYKSDATRCFIDTLPKSVTDYNNYIKSIFPADPRLFLDLFFFNEKMPMDDRRNLITQTFGELTDEQVAESLPELKEVLELKGKHSVEEWLAINKNQVSECNKKVGSRSKRELGEIPSRIDELSRKLPDTPIDVEAEEKEIKKLEKQIGVKELEISKLSSSDLVETLKGDLIKKENALAQLEADEKAFIREQEEKNENEKRKARDEYLSVTAKLESPSAISVRINTLKSAVEKSKQSISQSERAIQALSNSEWQGDTTCPTCGQDIPEDQIAEAKGNFNEDKSDKIAAFEAGIVKNQETIKGLKDDIASEQKKLNENEATIDSANKEYQKRKATLDAFTPKHKAGYTKKKAVLEGEISNLKDSIKQTADGNPVAKEKIDSLKADIKSLRENVDSRKRTIMEAESDDADRSRIKELEKELLNYSTQLQDAERNVKLAEDFISGRADLITSTVNEKFDGVTFRLFDSYKEGGLKNSCEVLYKGVPYGGLSFARKHIASLAVINGFARHFDFTSPLFLDNGESVRIPVKTDSQLIRINVSADKEMQIKVG